MKFVNFQGNDFSDECSEIVLEQKWSELQNVSFLFSDSAETEETEEAPELITKLIFWPLCKVDLPHLEFGIAMSSQEVPPEVMHSVVDFNLCYWGTIPKIFSPISTSSSFNWFLALCQCLSTLFLKWLTQRHFCDLETALLEFPKYFIILWTFHFVRLIAKEIEIVNETFSFLGKWG